MKNCPYCKNEPTTTQIINNTKCRVNDFPLFCPENYDPQKTFEEQGEDVHIPPKKAFIINIKCPFCSVSLCEVLLTKYQYKLQDFIIEKWNEMKTNPDKNKCPRCNDKILFDEDEFCHPAQRYSDENEVVDWTVNCDAGGIGCGFSIKYKSNKKNGKTEAYKVWNKIYNH